MEKQWRKKDCFQCGMSVQTKTEIEAPCMLSCTFPLLPFPLLVICGCGHKSLTINCPPRPEYDTRSASVMPRTISDTEP